MRTGIFSGMNLGHLFGLSLSRMETTPDIFKRPAQHGPGKRSVLNVRFTPVPKHSYRPKHKLKPRRQFPEYLALEAKNIASGKWEPNTATTV